MKKKKFIIPLLFLSLALGGCGEAASLADSTPVDSATSIDGGEDVTSDITDSGEEIATSVDMEAEGYTRSEGWPKAQIDTHLETMEVVERLPEFQTDKETFYAVYEEPFIFQQEIVEVAIFDTTAETLNALQAALVAAGWTDYPSEEENQIQLYNAEETIGVFGGLYAGDPEFPSMTLFYVVGFDQRDPLKSFEIIEGWPTDKINAYLAIYGVTDVVVPALLFNGDGYFKLIDDSEYYDPYLMLVIPGGNRIEEYKGILTAGGFPWVEDENYPDYFIAKNAAKNVVVEFSFDEAEYNYPAGMYIYISAETTEGGGGEGGEITPVNPASKVSFSFADESQIKGTKNGDLTTWQVGEEKMEIKKASSTVKVGNLGVGEGGNGYFANPLRIYASQEVIITGSQNIDVIEFETHAGHPGSVDILINSLPEGVIHETTANGVSVKVSGETKVFTLTASAQFRLMGFNIYFK